MEIAQLSIVNKKQEWPWGVGHACNCRSILKAIASLIEADLSDLAMVLIEQELNSQTSPRAHHSQSDGSTQCRFGR